MRQISLQILEKERANCDNSIWPHLLHFVKVFWSVRMRTILRNLSPYILIYTTSLITLVCEFALNNLTIMASGVADWLMSRFVKLCWFLVFTVLDMFTICYTREIYVEELEKYTCQYNHRFPSNRWKPAQRCCTTRNQINTIYLNGEICVAESEKYTWSINGNPPILI